MSVPLSQASSVAVIGAGPVGLAAAAHLIRRGIGVVVFEAGLGVASHLESGNASRLSRSAADRMERRGIFTDPFSSIDTGFRD
ncbi:FAD-dependent oxidoreductase [Acidovorax sp. LjRoot129]